ncbi:MAG TPA: hypothetical protein V6D13_13530 [Halomicronema sp.]
MNLDKQIQVLIDNAPQDGTTPQIVAAIAPALKILAGQLSHAQYYIVQSLKGEWVLTTLSNRAQPNLEKQVIYAFPTSQDALSGEFAAKNPQLMAWPVPVIHILFQMLTLQPVESILFFDIPGNQSTGTEVLRSQVQYLIQEELKKLKSQPKDNFNIPPDIA